jgi:hypothetical protein
MGMGSPHVYIKEYDLSEIVPSFRGVTAAIAFDAGRGKVNEKQLITNEKQLIETFNEPNPRKFGLGMYSAINALKETTSLLAVRIDKGQTYSSALVRGKINPIVQYDDYGYILEKPLVDPIVKPFGAMTQTEFENFAFPVYPRDREVGEFLPSVHLIDKPLNGDTKFFVDLISSVEIGDRITFKDTNGMEREDAMQYQMYQVIEKEKELIYQDYIETTSDVQPFNYDTEIKGVRTYFVPTNPVETFIDKTINAGEDFFYSKDGSKIPLGSDISLDANNTLVYTVVGKTTENFSESYDIAINATYSNGNNVISTNDISAQLTVGDRVSISGNSYTIATVTGSSATLDSNITSNVNETVLGVANVGTVETSRLSIGTNTAGNGVVTYSFDIDGTTYTYDAADGEVDSDIALALVGVINTILGDFSISYTSGNNTIDILGSNVGHQLNISVNSGSVTNTVLQPATAPTVDSKEILFENFVPGITYNVNINGTVYSYIVQVGDTSTDIANGISSAVSSTNYTTNVSGSSLVINGANSGVILNVLITIDTELKKLIEFDKLQLNDMLLVNIPAGRAVRIGDIQTQPYMYRVYAKELDPANPRKIRVSSNDPILENDVISINGLEYTVQRKYQLQNYVNTLTVDTEYLDQTGALIGDIVYKIEKADFEEHDSFLVMANTPGEWGDDIAIAIRDSENYKEAFYVDVYYQGALVETFECSMENLRDGYGRQLFIEEKINDKSSYIKVKVNDFMVDEDDKPVEPLKTLYYVRQPVKTPNYNRISNTRESIWDRDNYITIDHKEIMNIDVTKPVMIGDGIYTIATLLPGIQGGPIDTIVLEQIAELNLGNLLPLDRNLPVGTEVKQYFDRAKEFEVTVTTMNQDELYHININSVSYEYMSLPGDSEVQVLTALRDLINNDSERVEATLIGTKLFVKSSIPGVDFTHSISTNMVDKLIAENSRQFTNYPVQKIDNRIFPTVRIGSEIELNDERYVILDAGANLQVGGDDIGYPTIGQYLTAIDTVFADPEQSDFLVIMDGGLTHKAIQQRLVEICEKRMDAFALLSVDWDAQANPDINAVLNFRDELLIDSSYGALYTPWLKIYDKFNDFEMYISPESFAARSISYVSNNRELWFPAAGRNNGRVTALDVYRRYTKGERDAMYDKGINFIKYSPGSLSIDGQKTLQIKPSRLDRIHVRLLLIVIERALRDYLEFQKFELNDTFTRVKIKSAVESYLLDIKGRRGLQDFDVVVDESNNGPQVIDNNEMYVDVYLKPIGIAEYITARVVITRSGANFSEVRL